MFAYIIKPLFIFVLLLTASCDSSSNPVAVEDHIDAEGFVLEVNEAVVYREFQGAITVNDLTITTDTFLEVSVHLLDSEGNEIEHGDEEEEPEGLTFDIIDKLIISVEAEEHEEGDDGDDHVEEHHELGFELTGLAEGSTTFTFSVMHEGHADYTSLPINVTVNLGMFSCSGKQLCLKNCCAATIYASK